MSNLCLPDKKFTGPRQLVAWLAENEICPQDSLTVLTLDKDRRLADLKSLPANLDRPAIWPEVKRSALVAVLTTSDPDPRAIDWLRAMERNCPGHLLDLLWISGERWRSAICKNSQCCPAEGRPVQVAPPANAAWTLWQASLAGAPLQLGTVGSLADLRVRDALLVRLTQPEARPTVVRVMREFLGLTDRPKDVAAAHCVIAAAAYLEGDILAATSALDEARKAISNYSLAALLQQGLEVKAPPELLIAAFENCPAPE